MNSRTMLIAALAAVLGAGVTTTVVGAPTEILSVRLYQAPRSDAGWAVEICPMPEGVPCTSIEADNTFSTPIIAAAKGALRGR